MHAAASTGSRVVTLQLSFLETLPVGKEEETNGVTQVNRACPETTFAPGPLVLTV